MCHINAATYQAYINQRVQCDTTAAFLGRPLNTALMKAAGHMSRFVNPRALTTASPEELQKLKRDPKLVQLVELRDFLRNEIRRESGTTTKAQQAGTKLYEMYRSVESQVRSTRSYLRKLATTRTRDSFFDTINTDEINFQLRGKANSFLDLDEKSWQPQTSHSLKERQLVAELICAVTTTLDDETRLKHRLYSTQAMVELGKRRESRPLKSAAVKPLMVKPIEFPTACSKDQCFFCFWDEEKPHGERLRTFCSAYRARDHLISQHLKEIGQRPIRCPEPRCKEAAVELRNGDAFKTHVTKEHKYAIFNRYGIHSGIQKEVSQRQRLSCRSRSSLAALKMPLRPVSFRVSGY